MNVIYANFSPEFKINAFQSIKYLGVKRVEKELIEADVQPAFVKALIKNIMRNMGW